LALKSVIFNKTDDVVSVTTELDKEVDNSFVRTVSDTGAETDKSTSGFSTTASTGETVSDFGFLERGLGAEAGAADFCTETSGVEETGAD
jgi:hypothetical protein